MIVHTPYARMLGIQAMADEAGVTTLMMPAAPSLEGRAGFLYGGVIASLLELACLEAVAREGGKPWPKPINMSFDFLRGGLMIDSYAQARLVRIGRQVANVDATCWQKDREKSVATGRMHLLLD